LLLYLIHPVGRRYGKSVQEHGCYGHILASLGEGRTWPLLVVDRHSPLRLQCGLALV
jgi:hypothetical protein